MILEDFRINIWKREGYEEHLFAKTYVGVLHMEKVLLEYKSEIEIYSVKTNEIYNVHTYINKSVYTYIYMTKPLTACFGRNKLSSRKT